ncbi:hypothetical protein OPV22_008535 [Ensete ventricosum]|uniref:Secreted protein n=1 Tax=Ensete ventricosum TaxID=4639 RepID=A0AAV8RGR4_ENSVE|nr:hypothetical protein OPV22_008535 [Ensete ventricosum]
MFLLQVLASSLVECHFGTSCTSRVLESYKVLRLDSGSILRRPPANPVGVGFVKSHRHRPRAAAASDLRSFFEKGGNTINTQHQVLDST